MPIIEAEVVERGIEPAVERRTLPSPRRQRRAVSRFLARHRRPIFVVHKWLSIVTMVWVVIECVTGGVLVLHDEIDHWTHRGDFHATEGDVGADVAVVNALATRDIAFANSVSLPDADGSHGMYMVGLYDEGGDFHRVIVDPGTGDVTNDDYRSVWLVGEIADLHYNLNSTSVFGLTGFEAQAILSLVFLVVIVTGFYLWYWPRMRSWSKVLTIRRHLGRYRWHLDLHNAVGLAALLPLVVIAITGIRFGYPNQVNSVYDAVTLGSYDPPVEELVRSGPANGRAPIGYDAAVTVAERLGVVDVETVLATRGSPVNTYEVIGTIDSAALGMVGGERTVGIHIDQYSGHIVEVHDPADDSVVNRAIDGWANPIHFGSFAGWPGRVLWLLVAAAPVVLTVTGAVMWINRRNVRQRRRASALVAAVGDPTPLPPTLEERDPT